MPKNWFVKDEEDAATDKLKKIAEIADDKESTEEYESNEVDESGSMKSEISENESK